MLNQRTYIPPTIDVQYTPPTLNRLSPTTTTFHSLLPTTQQHSYASLRKEQLDAKQEPVNRIKNRESNRIKIQAVLKGIEESSKEIARIKEYLARREQERADKRDMLPPKGEAVSTPIPTDDDNDDEDDDPNNTWTYSGTETEENDGTGTVTSTGAGTGGRMHTCSNNRATKRRRIEKKKKQHDNATRRRRRRNESRNKRGNGPVFSNSKPSSPPPPPPPPPPPKKKRVMFTYDTKGDSHSHSHMTDDKSDAYLSAPSNYIRNKNRRFAVGAYNVRQYEEKRRQDIEDFSKGKRGDITTWGKNSGGTHTRRKRSSRARSKKRRTRKHR